MDVHKKEAQIRALTEDDELIERRVRPSRDPHRNRA